VAVVLVIEDEDQVRVLAESYLEEQGHECLSAATRDGVMALLEKTPHVDLLFADIDLKGEAVSGIDLARESRHGDFRASAAFQNWPTSFAMMPIVVVHLELAVLKLVFRINRGN
jgi:CheY-like chemotaxis protein